MGLLPISQNANQLGIWNVDVFSPKIRIGGGIIRDCKGRMLISFCNLYGLTTNMVAEFRAILDGLRLCNFQVKQKINS